MYLKFWAHLIKVHSGGPDLDIGMLQVILKLTYCRSFYYSDRSPPISLPYSPPRDRRLTLAFLTKIIFIPLFIHPHTT